MPITRAVTRRFMRGNLEPALQQPQGSIRRERQQRRRNGAGEHQADCRRRQLREKSVRLARRRLPQLQSSQCRYTLPSLSASPARMNEAASGNSTLKSRCELGEPQGLAPLRSPRVDAANSSVRIPQNRQADAYAVSAKIAIRAARSPSHGSGSRKPNIASEGIVCRIFVTPIIGLAQPWRACEPDSGRHRNRRCKKHGRRRSATDAQRRERGNLAAVLCNESRAHVQLTWRRASFSPR